MASSAERALWIAVALLLNLTSKCTLAYGDFGSNANAYAPVIGVLTLPCTESPELCEMVDVPFNVTTYVPASYVKFLEGGGARVIPLQSDMEHDKMRDLISQINGILFTGGNAYFKSANFMWQQHQNILSYVREYHEKHNKSSAIPIWGTCLGFEAMVCGTAQDGVNVMDTTEISAMYISLPLNFTENAITSRIFNSTMEEGYSNDAYNALEANAITYNEHYYGFKPNVFETDAYLRRNFTVLATSVDVNDIEFVALIESASLSWFGSQFHPEKPMYEFEKNVPKTLDAIYSNQYFADFFVNECQIRNDNEMKTYKYDDISIYNYDAYDTAKQSNYQYQQMYLFPASQSQNHSSSTNDDGHDGNNQKLLIIIGVIAFCLICVLIVVTIMKRKKPKDNDGDYAFKALDGGDGVQMGDT